MIGYIYKELKNRHTTTWHVAMSIGLHFIVWLSPNLAWSQEGESNTEPKKELTIKLEFRPRTEYRNGYRQLRNDTTTSAFFTEQRSRLYLNYKTDNFIFHTSIQDIRVWGEQDPRSTSGTLQIFEAFVEPTIVKGLSARIGRQKIMYDNQRLFAQNDWRQNGGAHDAVRLMYKNKKWDVDVIGAFNQQKGAQENFFGTDYSPEFSNYKMLLTNFIKYKTTDRLTLTSIQVAEGFQDAADATISNHRYTSGGRVEFEHQSLYLTLAVYYQYGENSAGTSLRAYYLQPEFKYKAPKYLTFRIGTEVFSGNDATKPSTTSHSFDALYGVNHRFLGSMDLFTRFPKDLNNAGLIAPYFFTFIEVNKKLTFRTDEHLFYSQNNFLVNGQVISKYLGFENDLLMIYKPNTYTEIQLGYSYGLWTQSMTAIKSGGDHQLWQDWAFLMITFNPEILRWTN